MQPIHIIEKDDFIYTNIRGQNSSLLKMKSFSSRKVGLLNHSSLAINSGVYYKYTKIFHTFYMKFPITVMCLDKNYNLLSSSCIVNTNSIFICPRKTKYTFEMSHAGQRAEWNKKPATLFSYKLSELENKKYSCGVSEE